MPRACGDETCSVEPAPGSMPFEITTPCMDSAQQVAHWYLSGHYKRTHRYCKYREAKITERVMNEVQHNTGRWRDGDIDERFKRYKLRWRGLYKYIHIRGIPCEMKPEWECECRRMSDLEVFVDWDEVPKEEYEMETDGEESYRMVYKTIEWFLSKNREELWRERDIGRTS